MDAEIPKFKGVVNEVGLERAEAQFRSFNLKIGMVVKDGKNLTYDQGEKLMKRLRKQLLGKEVEVTAVVFLCPTCGKGFNTELGMKQHMRIVHTKKRRAKTKKTEKPEAKGRKGKSTSKRASKKKTSRKRKTTKK